MGIVPIVTALIGLIALIARRIMESGRRLSTEEFVVARIVLVPLLAVTSMALWSEWREFRAGFGLAPFPKISYYIYSVEELALSPVIVTTAIYFGLVFLLSLKHWPEDLPKGEVRDWQVTRVRNSLWVLIPLLCIDLAYLSYKWYPVWGVWLFRQ